MMAAAPRARRPMQASGFTDPDFRHIADLAREVAGLVFPQNREPSAEAGMRRTMATLRLSTADALLRAVAAPGAARDALLAELTVGESYFFRDEAQVRFILGSIVADTRRPLRLWSAGCASGEEPYTLAILLRELGSAQQHDIRGTDIALPRLAAARKARYTRWALRGASDERITRWFARDGASYVLAPMVREAVTFQPLNLTVDEYPALGHDLILCRNVMIYFDLTTAARIAERLLDALAPDGWLLLGASDPPLVHLVACEAVMTQWGLAYRRAGRTGRASPPAFVFEPDAVREFLAHPEPVNIAPPVEVLPVAPVVERRTSIITAVAVLGAYAAADYAATETLAAAYLAEHDDAPDALEVWIACVRAVANQGRLPGAGELCSRALELHPMSPELHYLHATLLAEAGWLDDAELAARRAIYLDRHFVMGHLLLGDLLARRGKVALAQRALENALAQLERADPAATIAAADGVPAARLRQIAKFRLDAIRSRGIA